MPLPQQVAEFEIGAGIGASLPNGLAKQLIRLIALAAIECKRFGQLQLQQRMRHRLGDEPAQTLDSLLRAAKIAEQRQLRQLQ